MLRSPRGRLGVLMLSTVLSAALFACGDDDSSGGEDILLDPAQGDALAHQVLLTEQDLPGQGWQVLSNDSFDDSGFADVDSQACKSLEEQTRSAKDAAAAQRSGRAARELGRDDPDFTTSVSVEVAVFKETEAPEKALDALRSALKGSLFDECFKDAVDQSVGPGSEAKVTSQAGTLMAPVPEGGAGKAVDVHVEAAGEKIDLHFETYTWRRGNTGLTVSLSGTPANVTHELATASINKVQANVTSLSGSK